MAEAMISAMNATNIGNVIVETGDLTPESVPVEICFADTVGDILAFDLGPYTDGAFDVGILNYIESNIKLQSSLVRVRQDGRDVKFVFEGIEFPKTLAPKDEVQFKIRPLKPLTDAETLDIIFDTTKAEIEPNQANILDSICDTLVPSNSVLPITVMTTSKLLGNANDPNSIDQIFVKFWGGGKLKLSRKQLEGTANVRVSLIET